MMGKLPDALYGTDANRALDFNAAKTKDYLWHQCGLNRFSQHGYISEINRRRKGLSRIRKNVLVLDGDRHPESLAILLMFPSRPELREISAVVGCVACFYPWIALTPLCFISRKDFRWELGDGCGI